MLVSQQPKASTSLGDQLREELRASKPLTDEPEDIKNDDPMDNVNDEMVATEHNEEPGPAEQADLPMDTPRAEAEVNEMNEGPPPINPPPWTDHREAISKPPPSPENVIEALAAELNWSYAEVVVTLEAARANRSQEVNPTQRRQVTALGIVTIVVVLAFGIGIGRLFTGQESPSASGGQQVLTGLTQTESPQRPQSSQPAGTESKKIDARATQSEEPERGAPEPTQSDTDVVNAVAPENPVSIQEFFVKSVEGNEPRWNPDEEVIAGQLFSPRRQFTRAAWGSM